MESSVFNRLFLKLFSRRSPGCLTHARSFQLPTVAGRRSLYSRPKARDPVVERVWRPRRYDYPEERDEEFKRYPTVTANELRAQRERPRKVKMLMRNFIEGRLDQYQLPSSC